jgi:thioredoxin reductase (NADPH)
MGSMFDVALIGSGIAGLTAAIRTAERGLSTCCVEAISFGGLVVSINELDPSPSADTHSGAEFAASLAERATDLGVEFIFDKVTALEKNGSALTLVLGADSIAARTVILASGAQPKPLGVPGEAEFEHRGLAHCAECDGPLHEGRDAVVVGGGDSAIQEALVLAKFCRNVFVVHHGGRFTAKPRFADRAAQTTNIHTLSNSEVIEIRGEESVRSVLVRRTDGGAAREIACAAVFPYVGLKPDLGYVKVGIGLDPDGFVIVDSERRTGVQGVLAAGIVRAGCGGLLNDAIADAEIAARSAAEAMASAVRS